MVIGVFGQSTCWSELLNRNNQCLISNLSARYGLSFEWGVKLVITPNPDVDPMIPIASSSTMSLTGNASKLSCR